MSIHHHHHHHPHHPHHHHHHHHPEGGVEAFASILAHFEIRSLGNRSRGVVVYRDLSSHNYRVRTPFSRVSDGWVGAADPYGESHGLVTKFPADVSCDIHTHTIPLPQKVLQASSRTILLCDFVLKTVLGMGMGMNVAAQDGSPERRTHRTGPAVSSRRSASSCSAANAACRILRDPRATKQ